MSELIYLQEREITQNMLSYPSQFLLIDLQSLYA